MITGTMDLKMSSGLRTPIDAIPTPDLAVPYEAPKFANTKAEAIPINPKNAAWPASTSSPTAAA
eukprot:CAMPEP_0197003556 /NCGR_PEP_ID=MMETSP1380-20130617/8458_1 /TAXON_ID=5936 /ORGANISM="Euplotes crassus, Strain CT5" /LENGTH=63 /DNA_ID=CAMNT_0042422093 /DNA_START=5 /DNA_END=196 /DNA_ORIENTATION=-